MLPFAVRKLPIFYFPSSILTLRRFFLARRIPLSFESIQVPGLLRLVAALLMCFGFFAGSCESAFAQGTIPAMASIEAHEYDTINLATLGIQLNVPVRTKAGHIPFEFKLQGSSQITNHISGNQSLMYASPALGGYEPKLGYQTAHWLSQSSKFYCGSLQYVQYDNWAYTDTEGSLHPTKISLLSSATTCGTMNGASYTTDGSGIYVTVVGDLFSSAIDVNGNQSAISTAISTYSDPNGNSMSVSRSGGGQTVTYTYTDSLKQVALVQTRNTGQPPTTPAEVDTWTDALGTNRSVQYFTTPLTLESAFGCNWTAVAPSTWNFPASVELPDGSSVTYGWEKTYNNSSQYTGRLGSITLPTGGTITYTYSGGTNGVNCTDGSPATIKRTTPDGTWTYTHVPVVGDTYQGPGTTTVTDPQGNSTVYTFIGANIVMLTPSVNPIESERQTYDSQGHLLQTIITCYNSTTSSPTNCNTSQISFPISQKDVYTTYPGVTGYSAVKTSYNTYGLVTDVKTFDFGASTPTNEKQIVYGSGSPSTQTCTAVSTSIIGKPCSVTLLDSQSGKIVTQTWNAYDSSGNLTQTWNLVSGSGSSGTYLSKSFTYANGVVQTSTDVNGQVINYTTTSCNNMFITSQYPTGFSNLKTSQTWDCNGAVPTSSTDANGQITQANFSLSGQADPFYRVLQHVDELGNATNLNYAPNSTESVFTFNNGQSVIDGLSSTDSIGRPVVSQLRQSPGGTNWDTKSRSFDNAGRLYKNTLPCVTSSGSECAASTETQTYDGLNRPLVHTGTGGDVTTKSYSGQDVLIALTPSPTNEHAKEIQKELDGLGRLKSVCVISGATGSGSCQQQTAQTGFLTTYSYDAAGRLLSVVENAQSSTYQTRTYTYDLIGRILSETNPEWSGTKSFTYDSVTGTNCTSSSAGDLVQEFDPAGNTICHHYDGLHRETYTTYAGPNSNNVSKYFIYDAATVNGIAMSNAEGRMAEAYTCSGTAPPPTCSTKITDEGFSYDARGQMTAYYQSSPNSGGYYSLSANYWEDHGLKTVSGVGLPTLTFGGLDGEGRVTTVTASTGTNPVTGVLYNTGGYTSEPIGALLTTTLGSGDTQNFTYDKNTGRMTSYSASVGASPVAITGNLTWNANGTLAQNSIVDGYNTANTQVCNYLYDDFMRVASGLDGTPGVNCLNGSTKVWNQTFSYGSDAFGNLTKSTTGPGTAWSPGYNSASNHYSLSGTSYDADGNLTADTFHNYTWLADGHVASIVTGAVTAAVVYDAMGNKVEENIAGSIHEYVSAFGVSAQMTGQTQNSTLVSLPGGVQALYSGGTLARFRYPDWLGSIRAESDPVARQFTESVAFAPFGERYAQKGTPYNVDSFTGKPDQMVNDEYDFPAREEHNTQGRWVSPDPMRGTGNKYVYANNNPLSNVDVYGLYSIVAEVLGDGNTDEDPFFNPAINESSSDKAALTSQLLQFQCSNIDCSRPGVDAMLQSFGLLPTPESETTSNQQKTQATQTLQEQQPTEPQKKSGFWSGLWHGLRNLAHFHSWNYVKATVQAEDVGPHEIREPKAPVTAAADAVGLAAAAADSVKLGAASAIVSVANDHSPQNVITNVLGFVPGFGWPMAITGATNDFIDWGADNSTPGPKKVDPYDPKNQQLAPNLPTQDGGCLAAGLGPC
jgi:RHS repeat-associated protein